MKQKDVESAEQPRTSGVKKQAFDIRLNDKFLQSLPSDKTFDANLKVAKDQFDGETWTLKEALPLSVEPIDIDEPSDVEFEAMNPTNSPFNVNQMCRAVYRTEADGTIGTAVMLYGGILVTCLHCIGKTDTEIITELPGIQNWTVGHDEWKTIGLDLVATKVASNRWCKANTLQVGNFIPGPTICITGYQKKYEVSVDNATFVGDVIIHGLSTCPGWSGSPLIQSGKVVGIHTAGSKSGRNFAQFIKSETIARFFPGSVGY